MRILGISLADVFHGLSTPEPSPENVRRESSRDFKAAKKALNQVEIEATPEEYREFVAEKKDGGASQMVAASSKAGRFFATIEKPQPFRRETISAGATFYRMDGEPRRLLVVFTGRKLRPMLPTPVFLQFIDASRWNVLVLRDAARMHYRLGVEGFAENLAQLSHRVREFSFEPFEVVAFGTSMGGFPAIRLQLSGGADRAVSICGRFPSDAALFLSGKPLPIAFDSVCACLETRERPLVFLYAAENDVDRLESENAAALTGGKTVAVPGTDHHGLLDTLWEENRLAETLTAVL